MFVVVCLAAGGGLRAAPLYNEPPRDPGAAGLEPGVTGSVRPRAPARGRPAPATRGAYGGGFIELLMTGREPPPGPGGRGLPSGTAGWQMPPEPGPWGTAPAAPPVMGADPRMHPPVVAALPPAPDHARPIERVLDPRYQRQVVAYDGPHRPGTVVIDTPQKFLFLVQPGGKALRYGIGVGRPGFTWAGVKSVSMKREWPDWRPPAEMLRRRPDLPRHMAGGLDNPLGARALYLGSSLYRIHGTNEPHTIGQAVSSGCIRMTNEDVTDLYERVPVGAKVIVI